MEEINALGQACPMPTILTKKALKQSPGEPVKVLVDNEIATQNWSKMAEQMGLDCQVEQTGENHYEVSLSPEGSPTEKVKIEAPLFQRKKSEGPEPYIVVLHSETIGKGSDELGAILMKSFLFSLSEQEQLPEKILFYNGGAKLTAEGSPVLDDLKAMEQAGVDIMTCGICVEYYGFQEKLAVGSPTNMYTIVELESTYKTVCP